MRMRCAPVAAVLAVLTVTACGSTVQVSGTRQVAGVPAGTTAPSGVTTSTPDGTGAPVTSGGAGLPDGSSGAVRPGSTGGATTGGAPNGGDGSVPQPGHTAGPTAVPVVTGPRITKPITLGFSTIDYGGVAKQFGVNLSSDFYAGFRNMFAYLNAHGGLAGRQVKGIYHLADGAAPNYASESQRTCSAFTEDAKADVVFTYIYAQPALAACLQKKGVAQIDNQQYALTEGELATLPGYLNPVGITLERHAKAVLGGLASDGVLTSRTVVGVMTFDCANNRNTNEKVVPALAKQYGFRVVGQQFSCYNGFGDLGRLTSEVQSAVLRFRQNGVTHVIALTAGEGYVIGQFAKSADSQKYYPGYLLSSNAFPTSNADGDQYGAAMLAKTTGYGWSPYVDLGKRAAFGAAATARQQLCRTMDPTLGNRASGDPALQNNLTHFFYAECDQLLLLKQILEANGGDSSLAAVRAGYERLASGVPSASLYGGRFQTGPRQHDGPALMQRFSWSTGCSCFTTVGAPRALPS